MCVKSRAFEFLNILVCDLSPDLFFFALQIKHGAVGMCCQTLVEAEAMVYGGGITDVLISNQVYCSDLASIYVIFIDCYDNKR